jgi:hypothetical protein
MSKKSLPDLFNVEAERQVLGAVLLDAQEVLQFPTVKALQPADFWDARHRDIWAAILALANACTSIDQITVADELNKRGQLVVVGGATALLDAVNDCLSYANADHHAGIVLSWARRRRVRDIIAGLGASLSKDGPFDAALREALDGLSTEAMAGTGPVEARTMEAIREFFGNITWAWPSWIPVGHLSMIAGPQSCGKSYLAARLIATLSGHYEYWPDGTPVGGFDKLPCRCLLAETEQMRGAYAQRLEAMGVGSHWVIFGPGDETHVPDLLREADVIERLARQESVGAIIVDSLSGGHSLKEDGAEMRRLLVRYAAMAARLYIPVILVHHARKRGEVEAMAVTLDRIRGSSTITQFCRSVLTLYRLQENDQQGPVRMEAIKCAFCAPPPAIGFTITGKGLTFCDAPELARGESQLDRACDLLLALLADGPVASTELEDEAEGAGISWKTAKRAKVQLGIVAKREKKEGESTARWYWALPSKV